ncbi:GGDEF domain-containing protein [Ruminococcus flavefaciens]|uniref:GGDEF domain-containing protein n=1 Tax=Ruminococcus flavefaciens TaxID=1265 RepID=UPI0004902C2D|nr:GGDEF domain-containing protein [Ruminococcus flavefaciens]
MKKKLDISELFNKMGQNRNTIFLIMCLMVHVAYFSVFLIMGAIPLSVVNAVSSVFYILFLFFSKDREKSEKATVSAYFEIIAFSTVCELFTRNTFGFIYFVIGMVPVIFYLSPSYGSKRFIFQIIGVISALMIHHTQILIPDSFFQKLYKDLLPYSNAFNFVNLVITLFTILYTAFFYTLELETIKKELDYSSTHDPLTGLYNRRFLYDTIIKENEAQISIILLDIDNFKKINDRFGHDKGDEVLIQLSSCIKEEVSKDGFYPVRWGGEEFILYYRELDIESVYELAKHLCKLIPERVVLPDNNSVTVTVGLAAGKQSDFDSIVKKADEKLYYGKNNGKNQVVI